MRNHTKIIVPYPKKEDTKILQKVKNESDTGTTLFLEHIINKIHVSDNIRCINTVLYPYKKSNKTNP